MSAVPPEETAGYTRVLLGRDGDAGRPEPLRVRHAYYNLPSAELVARSLARQEGILAANGAIVVHTGRRTGRSPDDRFIVDSPVVHEAVDWGAINRPCSRELLDKLWDKAAAFLQHREVFVFDGFAGADPDYRIPVRVVAEATWHALFAHTLFQRPTLAERQREPLPELTVVAVGSLSASPEADGTRSEAFIGLDLERRLVLIVGSLYGGEIKKAVFSVLNYLLPPHNVLPMHCAANVGVRRGDVALFFGLSGTGKTTLSADPNRRLLGDDEHGWSDEGVFNFEGGCYAKVIRLSARAEPGIYRAIRFGSILENVIVDPLTRQIDYDDDSLTENTRATYPLRHIRRHVPYGMAGHPATIFFLTCDAFGVLPPIARLTPAMASYYFLAGFTAKVGGTEAGVSEPTPTFSACFGAPFMPRAATVYADMLARLVRRHKVACWLVNTGWSGGPYGTGKRIAIGVTRKLLTAALDGALEHASMRTDQVFGFKVPEECPGVSAVLLEPRGTWAQPELYDRAASELAARFRQDFTRYDGRVSGAVRAAGPRA